MKFDKKYDDKTHATTYTITVTPDDVKPFKGKAEDKLTKDVKLQGFRKGKVPKDLLLEKISPEQVVIETIQFVASAMFEDVLKQDAVEHFVGRPMFSLDPKTFSFDKDYTFSFAIATFLKLKWEIILLLNLKPPKVEIADKDLEDERKQFEMFLKDVDAKQNATPGAVPVLNQSFQELIKKYTSLQSVEEFEQNARKICSQ